MLILDMIICLAYFSYVVGLLARTLLGDVVAVLSRNHSRIAPQYFTFHLPSTSCMEAGDVSLDNITLLISPLSEEPSLPKRNKSYVALVEHLSYKSELYRVLISARVWSRPLFSTAHT